VRVAEHDHAFDPDPRDIERGKVQAVRDLDWQAATLRGKIEHLEELVAGLLCDADAAHARREQLYVEVEELEQRRAGLAAAIEAEALEAGMVYEPDGEEAAADAVAQAD
jgi:TolA-binding protein